LLVLLWSYSWPVCRLVIAAVSFLTVDLPKWRTLHGIKPEGATS
jgi:hypothetical protein